jgi:NADH:ubiquinone oxidoreductase subunit 5 (subunit L)/multisubunit Na+/H+ antiporter MnhA subunit
MLFPLYTSFLISVSKKVTIFPFDRWIIAGLAVRGLHGTVEFVGRALRLAQTGNLQTYAFLTVLGLALILYLALR